MEENNQQQLVDRAEEKIKITIATANTLLTRGAAARHPGYWEASAAPRDLRDQASCVNAFSYAGGSEQRLFVAFRGMMRLQVFRGGGC